MKPSPESQLIIGLMSGTSLDGIDAALVLITPDKISALHTQFSPFDSNLRQALQDLAEAADWEPDTYYRIQHNLSEQYAEAVNQLLNKANASRTEITTIACHGQTLRHRPGLPTPYTVQAVNGALLAELTDISVITDFRARDMAAGGEGAPLAPAFHFHFFAKQYPQAGVVNIGGFANLTCWDQSGAVTGYDTGPGNVLLDGWMRREFNKDFDNSGELCSAGAIHPELLQELLRDPYFAKPAPKSTGREYFHMAWLLPKLASHQPIAAADVLTTLAELTAVTIANEISTRQLNTVFICGGGVNNRHLMQRLRELLPASRIDSSTQAGIDPDYMEAIAFAWFGYQTLNNLPANCPSVTGAKGPRVLGAIYPR